MESTDHWGTPSLLQEVHEAKTIFIIILTVIYLFTYVDICADGAKAMMGKTGGTLACIKTTAPNCTSYHCSYHHNTCILKKSNSLKNILDNMVKITIFIKV